MPRKQNLTGQKYGKLLVLNEGTAQRASRRHIMWVCLCDCGGKIEVRSSRLRSGHTKSCGCLQQLGTTIKRSGPRKGSEKHPLYGTWIQMIHRCSNPKHDSYKYYGGRGIKVCERWLTFKQFVADMGERPLGHQIDRKNNDLGYNPNNCRWVLPIDQARNTRANRQVTVRGRRMGLSVAAERFGVPYWTAHSRLRRGWTEEQALGLTSRLRKTWTDKWARMDEKERHDRIIALNIGRKRQAACARETTA